MGIPFDYVFDLVKGDRTTRTLEYLTDGTEVDFSDVTVEWFFNCRGVEVLASTGNGRIVTTSEGFLNLDIPGSVTATLEGAGFHVLKITAPYVRTLLTGEVKVYDPIG